LLREPIKPAAANSEEEHRQNAENLLRILSEFGVEVTLGEIHVGPVITRYEIIPAAGVRVERIASLDKNIALGMRAQSVRILAPIPGKAAVGVEVPNQQPTPVGMRELLESEDWAAAKAEIPIALGKDVSGKPLVSDLSKMPHLLIAGATGSGKSVCINSVVASIIYSKSPKDLRLIMVDPKVVELKIFNTLPHMLIPVVTEPKKVPAALKWLLREMEQRYQIFAKVNVRNIIGFNGRKKGSARRPAPAPEQASLEGLDPLSTEDVIEIPGPLALHRRDHRRTRRLDDGVAGGNRNEHRATGAVGPRGRHPSYYRHAAPLGERHHRSHQSQPALAHCLPGGLAGRLAHDSGHRRVPTR
jgi:S-DNA-T family DNA segregation ATPase FtsK/SpoIIIE